MSLPRNFPVPIISGIVNRPRSPAHWHDAGRRAREGQGVGDGRDDGDEEVREKIRAGDQMGKYRTLALILDKIPGTGTAAWQNAVLLFKFRNNFMHFKPAWDHQTDIHDSELVKEIRKRVPVTPAHKPNFVFPYGLMTYGCAKWALESASAFSAEFCALVGVTDRFAGMSNLP